MKRYLIFGAIGPFVGGLLMLFAITMASGYWAQTDWREVGKFFGTFVKTLQYSYLFGVVPALMIGAIDGVIPVSRAADSLVGAPMHRGRDRVHGHGTALWLARPGHRRDAVHPLYGLVGGVPAVLSSWLAHKYADEQAPVHST